MRRRYYERPAPGVGRVILEATGLRPRIVRFAYCSDDGRVFVSDDLALLDRVLACPSDEAAAYVLQTRADLGHHVVLSASTAPGGSVLPVPAS